MQTIKIAVLSVMFFLFAIALAGAHCDSMDGPVITAAKADLAVGAPNRVLSWVQPADEAAIKEAFHKTMEVRKLGGKAAVLADTWFFETLVRVHRSGEGAPYTGLKPAGSADEIIKELDAAIVKGDINELAGKIGSHAEHAIKEKFAAFQPLKKEADKSVENGRKYVAAYVEFMHYVEGIKNAVHGAGHHAEAAKAESHEHKD